MKIIKSILLIAGIMVILISMVSDSGAYSTKRQEGEVTCLAPNDNPGNGAIALRGTVAVEVVGLSEDSEVTDVILRLERGPVQKFFRINIIPLSTENPGYVQKQEQIACLFLDRNHPNVKSSTPAVPEFVENILNAFGLDPSWELVVTSRSITDTEPLNDAPNSPHDFSIPGTERAVSLADIVIYAVAP